MGTEQARKLKPEVPHCPPPPRDWGPQETMARARRSDVLSPGWGSFQQPQLSVSAPCPRPQALGVSSRSPARLEPSIRVLFPRGTLPSASRLPTCPRLRSTCPAVGWRPCSQRRARLLSPLQSPYTSKQTNRDPNTPQQAYCQGISSQAGTARRIQIRIA